MNRKYWRRSLDSKLTLVVDLELGDSTAHPGVTVREGSLSQANQATLERWADALRRPISLTVGPDEALSQTRETDLILPLFATVLQAIKDKGSASVSLSRWKSNATRFGDDVALRLSVASTPEMVVVFPQGSAENSWAVWSCHAVPFAAALLSRCTDSSFGPLRLELDISGIREPRSTVLWHSNWSDWSKVLSEATLKLAESLLKSYGLL